MEILGGTVGITHASILFNGLDGLSVSLGYQVRETLGCVATLIERIEYLDMP